MALTTVTVQPNAVAQQGTWSNVGAATGWQCVSDGSDSTYVQLPSGLCRLDSQRIRFGFPAITIPTGARIYSVGIRRRVQTIHHQIPVCLHWLRSEVGLIEIVGQILPVFLLPFSSPCPSGNGEWVTESVSSFITGPDGQPWSLTTNLVTGNFFYEMGRNDDWLFSPLRVSEVYLDVTYQSVSSVTVTGPTGTISATKATVTWNYSSADSQPQQSYQVAVYTQDQTAADGFEPFTTAPIDGTGGWVLGEAQQWTMNIDLTNGDYAAYVQAESQWAGPGDFLSSIGSTTWTRSATGPPTTAVLSSATFQPGSNRIELVIAPGVATPPTPDTTSLTVQASRDGRQSWSPIPSLSYIPVTGTDPITVYDYVAPINVESWYRVIAYGGTPLQAASETSGELSATPRDNRFWLKSPMNPLLNTVLPVAAPKQSETGIKITKRRMQGTFQLLAGSGSQVLPFIVSGPTYGDEYEIELIFIDGDEFTPMTLWPLVDELDRSGDALLLQKPDGDQLWVITGPGVSGQDTEETFNSVAGDPTVTLWRRRKLVLTQVKEPAYF